MDNACVVLWPAGINLSRTSVGVGIARQFNAIAVDMESAAVAQSLITKTDLVIIRESDGADEEAPVDFMSLIEQISQKIYEAVKKVIERL